MSKINNHPFVSIIVTTFNRKDLLTKTIDSILNQSYNFFELIIVDNYSDYDFFSFLESFNDKRIKGFQNQNNGIIAINRNFGIRKAKGEFIAFCDDDDTWRKNKLRLQLLEFADNPEIILVCSLAKKTGTSTSIWKSKYGIMYRKIDLSYNGIINNNPIILSSVLLRRNILQKVNCFSQDSRLISVEDLDLWLNLFALGKFCFVKEILIDYLVHDSNISSQNHQKQENYRRKKSENKSYKLNFIRQYSDVHIIYLIKNFIHLTLLIIYSAKSFLRDRFNINLINRIYN